MLGLGAGALASQIGCESPQQGSGDAPPTADLKIIDPHVHVWINDPKYPWPKENTNPPKEDALPETLLELMEANGVAHTVIVHPMHFRWDCRYVGDVMKTYPDKFQGVCRVNPEAANAADELRKWTEEWGYKGVRLSPSVDERGDWIQNDALMNPIWSRAQALKVPMCILTKGQRLPDIAALIERHPDLDVVIDHMADIRPNQPELLPNLLTLATYPRVYVKVSHTWNISSEDYPYRDTWEQVRKVKEAFGANRTMWGTDWPLVESRCGYAKALELVRDQMDFLSREDKEWMLSKTIERLWPFA